MLGDAGLPADSIFKASELYRFFGYDRYVSIDTNGDDGALPFDLNRNLKNDYGFNDAFDLVTNLGTLEHCFDQAAAFRNTHDICADGWLMIHCLPTQGLVNHGFYNYHPRFVADLAIANNYAVVSIFFTSDFRSEQISYSIDSFKEKDARDLMLYAVLRKSSSAPFATPFDGMFSASNKVGYAE